MRVTPLLLCLLVPLLSAADGSGTPGKVIRLAVTTSVENSGLFHHLLPRFVEGYPYEIEPTVAGSGRALRMARSGAVDVLWVHSPQAEKKFVDEGYGVNHQTFMRNDFVLAGPTDDPADIAAEGNIIDAFHAIFDKQQHFLSRGDDSGTNRKELSLWNEAGIDPYGTDWYIESGSGMAASLDLAQQINAYILIDRATFVVRHAKGFRVILEDPGHLSNPYSAIAVNPEKNDGVNLEGANALIRWIISEEGQNAIASYTHDGVQLYHPTRMRAP